MHTVTAKVFLNNGTSVLSTVSVVKPSPSSCP